MWRSRKLQQTGHCALTHRRWTFHVNMQAVLLFQHILRMRRQIRIMDHWINCVDRSYFRSAFLPPSTVPISSSGVAIDPRSP